MSTFVHQSHHTAPLSAPRTHACALTSVFDGLVPQQARDLAHPLVLDRAGARLQHEDVARRALAEPDLELAATVVVAHVLRQAQVRRLQCGTRQQA